MFRYELVERRSANHYNSPVTSQPSVSTNQHNRVSKGLAGADWVGGQRLDRRADSQAIYPSLALHKNY